MGLVFFSWVWFIWKWITYWRKCPPTYLAKVNPENILEKGGSLGTTPALSNGGEGRQVKNN